MIRRLIAWLNRRFPVQLVVTQTEYLQLNEELDGLSNSLVSLNKRFYELETQVRRLNESQGFSHLVKGDVRLER